MNLSDLILHCKRSHIPFIAVTQKPKSTLGRSATICLPLPRAEEACPNNLAPTTSALMALALGDALAMTVMRCKGFSAQDFRFLHPGGQLGRRLMKIKDLMHMGEEMPLVSSTVLMAEALILMTQKSLGCLGVVEKDKLIGMITDGDLRRHMHSNLTQKTVREIMTPDPLTMKTDALVVDAAAFMNDKKITAVFIVDSAEKPQGVLHIHDCLRAGFL